MKISASPLRNNLLSLKLTIPYDYATIVKEFESEDWIEHLYSTEKANSGHSNRSVLPNPKSLILKEILKFASSDEIKKNIINQLYQEFPNIKQLWEGWSADKMFSVTSWGGQFLKDSPGFCIEKHLDTRLQIATGLIYFVEDDDPLQSTIYYVDKTGSDPLRISTNFCDGVLHINDYDVWHEGANNSSKTRYLMILGLILNVK